MEKLAPLFMAMAAYESPSTARIAHVAKVHNYARQIALLEGVDEATQLIIEAAAIVHDIGIKVCLEKYGSHAGHLQETEGPPLAEAMLASLGFDEDVIKRVSFLVGHHHTYDTIDGIDYQILVESDFLVNLEEKGETEETIRRTLNDIFKTPTGKHLCRLLFGL
ncbi:MAG TPA: phosphohydrolase [Sphaerochaeta sp.]|nr:phosphohydrolase [Sphaerochaeta sp.]HQB90856.1 phosphohydrolase [Sphaerochaeta sp.]